MEDIRPAGVHCESPSIAPRRTLQASGGVVPRTFFQRLIDLGCVHKLLPINDVVQTHDRLNQLS